MIERGKHASVLLIGPLAVKVFKPGFGYNARKEIKALRELEKHHIAPRPYLRFGRVVVMSRIRGIPFRRLSDKEIRQLVPDFLRALHLLDRLGIKKEECHRPDKHFLSTPDGVRLIDFDRSHPGRGNVTQFMAYLNKHYPGIIELGPAYKENMKLQPVLDFIASS